MTKNRPPQTARVGDATAPPTSSRAAAPRRGPARLRLIPPDSPRRRQPTPLGVAPVDEPVLIGEPDR